MSEAFTKLFSSILRSSVWQEPASTKLAWITLLALANRTGYVGASIPGLAVAAGITIQEAEAAIAKFLAPDKYSRSKEHDGRRIIESDRGWTLLNYARFRAERDDEARKEWDRDRKRLERGGRARTRPQCPPPSAQAEAELPSVAAEAAPEMEGSKEGRGSPVVVQNGEGHPRRTSGVQSAGAVLDAMGLGGGS